LSKQKISGVTIQNQLAGTVTAIQQVGARMLVTVDVGKEIIAEVTAKAVSDLRITQGSTVYCLIKTQSIHALAST
jgi:molybdate transport system ATP-binding protein